MPRIVGMGAFTASILFLFDYTGGHLTGFRKDREVDGYAVKEAIRKNRRRPGEETIAELGDGRGGSEFLFPRRTRFVDSSLTNPP